MKKEAEPPVKKAEPTPDPEVKQRTEPNFIRGDATPTKKG